MAENIGVEIRRDTELEQRMLEAVIADRNNQPRSKQLQVGPSSVGGCRELLRAGLFESDTLAEPETNWATAAHVGQVMGESLEAIFGERLDALTQQRITATFGMLGVQISGAIDLLFMNEEQISDLKSTDDMGSVLYDLKANASIIESLLAIREEGSLYDKNIETADGGYELTEVLVSKIAKLSYYVQVSIYIVGAVQQGILDGNASGRLVFYDRSGKYQEFVALVITPEEVALFYEIGQMRLEQVVHAQMAYEGSGGNPAVKAHLRDMSPSFCFSPKVMCGRRMACWAGSDWANDNQITNPDQVAAVNRYVVGRDLEKLGKNMKTASREELRDVQGMLPDGKMVTWGGNGAINVVETTVTTPQSQAHLDEFVKVPDVVEQIAAEQEAKSNGVDMADVARRAMRERELSKLQKPALVELCTAVGLEPKGVKATLVGRILDHEAEHGEIQIVEPDGGGILIMPSDIAPAPQDEAASADFTEELMEAAQRPIEGHEDQGDLTAQNGPEFVDPDQRPNIAPNPPRPEVRAVEVQPSTYFDGDTPADAQPQWAGAPQQPEPERDPRTERVKFVDSDPRPIEEAPHVEVETAQPDPDLTPSWTGAPQHPGSQRLETQKAGYETAEVLQFRQKLFGLNEQELQAEAMQRRINPFEARQALIQRIIDHDYPPVPGRGWAPNGAGTTGDPSLDRLRQIQYEADPVMREKYEEQS